MMFGTTGKRHPRRTAVSGAEQALSWLVLAALAAMGMAVYLSGQRDKAPGLSLGDLSTLPAQERELAEPAMGRVHEPGPAAETRPRAAPELDLAQLAPAGFSPLGSAERYSPGDLYEKINGRAEQYVAYDVVALTFISMRNPKGDFIDVFVYDMGRPLNAFGIFSMERPPSREPLRLGHAGYQVAASFFFYQGPYYIQLLASADTDAVRRAALSIGRELESILPAAEATLWGRNSLPETGRVPGSLQYFRQDAMSLDFLGNAFTATYRRGDQELTAFVARRDAPDQAATTLAAYLEYISRYGELVDEVRRHDVVVHVGDLGGYYDAVFRHGRTVGGVAMAGNRNAAVELAADLLRHLSER